MGGGLAIGEGGGWLTKWWLWTAICLAGALPLLYPAVPPLTDVPAHMGRYEVQLSLANAPELQRWYGFRWRFVPNLGVDLLVEMLGPWLGVETATRLIVTSIPALQMAGYVLVARQAHGRVPPTVLFALPLAWCYPLQFGFINFALSVALATLAYALWRGMAARPVVRGLLFVPIACLLWIAHLYGWAVLCVLALCHAFVAQRGDGRRSPIAIVRACLLCLPLAVPQVVRFLLPPDLAGGTGDTTDFFNVIEKLGWIAMIFRDRWLAWDAAAMLIVVGFVIWSLVSRRFARDPALSLATCAFAILYVLLPKRLIGSHYADMRLAPLVFAFALIAIRPAADAGRRFVRTLAAAGLCFFVARIAGTTASLYLYDRVYTRELAALDHIPYGATLLSLVTGPCGDDQGWKWERIAHLPGLAVARRHAFSNDQWVASGAQLLSVRYPAAGAFQSDPSMQVTARRCDDDFLSLDEALVRIPPAFDHLWIVMPPRIMTPAGWRLIWHSGTSGLYARTPPAR